MSADETQDPGADERHLRSVEDQNAETGHDPAAYADAASGDDESGRSLEDGAGDAEMFPMGILDGDPKVTLGKLIRRGAEVEYTVSLGSAEVPLRGGLPDPETYMRLFVTAELQKVEVVAKRVDGDVSTWKVRAKMRPTFVELAEAAAADPATDLNAA